MNIEENKGMIFERREVEVVDFIIPYRVSALVTERCEVVLGERMEEVKRI